jgi:hypothetical protein
MYVPIQYNINKYQSRLCTHKRNTGALSPDHCRGKTISIAYSECLSVAVIQHTERTRCITSSIACDSTIFSTLSHKRHVFSEKIQLNIKRVFLFSLEHSCDFVLILKIIRQDMIINVHWSSLGAELFPADRQTDMTKLTVAFRNFVNAPKKHEPDINHNQGMNYTPTWILIYDPCA